MKNSQVTYQSLSAPKKFSVPTKPLFDFSKNSVSPGVSPSDSAIQNFPIEYNDSPQQKNVFFSSQIPLNLLKKLGEIDVIAEEAEENAPLKSWEVNQKRFEKWISKSCTTVKTSPKQFHKELETKKAEDPLPLENTPPPPGFDKEKPAQRKLRWADIGSDSDCTPTPYSNAQPKQPPPQIQVNQVKLQAPPKKGKAKREERGKFQQEQVTNQKHTGLMKFYHFKKKFGFITLDSDEKDVFLCEDDVVLSGINPKVLRNNIINKVTTRFSFCIKVYNENGKEKRKAVDLTILT